VGEIFVDLPNFVGFILAFLVGTGARWIKIPVPAPPTFMGVFLIVAITAGYLSMDNYLQLDLTEQNGASVEETQADPTKNKDAKN